MRTAAKRFLSALGLALTASLAATPVVGGEDHPYAPQPQATLKQMLSIDWKKGPNLPQGFQDSGVGIVDGTLVTAGGFCSGQTNVPEKRISTRGFLQKTWGLNLKSPQNGWQSLPDFPAAGRQGLLSATVDGQLYLWGGINYEAPGTYRDGYRFCHANGQWSWNTPSRLPSLPWPLCWSGVCALGSKIYVFGGSDYDGSGDGRIYTNTDRTGKTKRLGARLLAIDTKDLEAGWKELAECPGTPRFTPATAAAGGKLYVIGGAVGNDNPTKSYATVVDNWAFDPTSNEWSRLRDLPVSSGNFPCGRIVFRDRYVLLVGGFQYEKVANPDGTIRGPYGTASHFQGQGKDGYYNDVFVYDAKTGTFGLADKLPTNNNTPMTVVDGDIIHLFGGEVGNGAVVEGEPFGHHPDLYLTGTIRDIGH